MRSRKLRDVMAIAENEGLLGGDRTRMVRGRMPEALVAKAKGVVHVCRPLMVKN